MIVVINLFYHWGKSHGSKWRSEVTDYQIIPMTLQEEKTKSQEETSGFLKYSWQIFQFKKHMVKIVVKTI